METKARLKTTSEHTSEWNDYRGQLDSASTCALWENLGQLVTSEPGPVCVPAHWSYERMRPLLMQAGKLITAKEAERRVLVFENPAIRGRAGITQNLYAGLQLVLPGEVAPCHRHTASALRFVLEAKGAYTAVDGERTTMEPGDFVLTPSWTFHDHGNPGDTPAIWLDGLDCAIVNHFNTSFFEGYPTDEQPISRKEGDALARYGANLLPVDHKPSGPAAPLTTYRYSRCREALDRLHRNGPVHPCHGIKMQYANPSTGGYPFPTMAAFLQLLPAGFQGARHRSTDATVFCVKEGRGTSHIGSSRFAWKPYDVFVVPSWCPVSHAAVEEAVLFSFSDRAVQKSLGLWREEVPTSA